MTEEIETETQAKIAMIKNCVKKEYVKNEKNSVYIYEESQTKKKRYPKRNLLCHI